jgi:hypothetical protein
VLPGHTHKDSAAIRLIIPRMFRTLLFGRSRQQLRRSEPAPSDHRRYAPYAAILGGLRKLQPAMSHHRPSLPLMSNIELECPAYVEPTTEEISWLDSLPDAAHEVQNRLYCELERGHSGRHCSLGQSQDVGTDQTCWWIWWSDGTNRVIEEHDVCPASGSDGSEEDLLCLLRVCCTGR